MVLLDAFPEVSVKGNSGSFGPVPNKVLFVVVAILLVLCAVVFSYTDYAPYKKPGLKELLHKTYPGVENNSDLAIVQDIVFTRRIPTTVADFSALRNVCNGAPKDSWLAKLACDLLRAKDQGSSDEILSGVLVQYELQVLREFFENIFPPDLIRITNQSVQNQNQLRIEFAELADETSRSYAVFKQDKIYPYAYFTCISEGIAGNNKTPYEVFELLLRYLRRTEYQMYWE